MSQIQPELEDILRTLFDEYEGPVTGDLTAAQVEQWDSLANVQLVVMAERTFGVRFTTAEITSLAHLGALADLIRAKQG